MDTISLYYDKILDIFMSEYAEQICSASEGHCMKVTGLTLEVLKKLYQKICSLNTSCKFFILSESEEDLGKEYITPTKLVELRNDLTVPVLALVPVNSSTAVEDSINNATFHELSIGRLDDILLAKLKVDFANDTILSLIHI